MECVNKSKFHAIKSKFIPFLENDFAENQHFEIPPQSRLLECEGCAENSVEAWLVLT
jgi:hypothetical protein